MAMVTESNGVKPDMAKQRRQKQKEHRVSGANPQSPPPPQKKNPHRFLLWVKGNVCSRSLPAIITVRSTSPLECNGDSKNLTKAKGN